MKFKKVPIYTSFCLCIIIGGIYYWFSSKKEAQEEAISWVKEHAGKTEITSNPLVEKIPNNLKFLKKLFGKDITSLDLSSRNKEIDYSYEFLDDPNFKKPKINTEQINDISILERFTSLEILYLDGTEVSDISVLKHLSKLNSLDLSRTRVRDLSNLKELVNLKNLNLEGAEVSDISALKHLKQLEFLNLALTDVKDFSALYDLKNLKTLNLYVTPISSKDLKELKKKLPKCSIYSPINSNFDYIEDFLKQRIPRFRSNEEVEKVFNGLGENAQTNNPVYRGPIVFRSKGTLSEKQIINLDVENMTAGEIIYYLCLVSNCKYKIEKHAIIIYPHSALSQSEREQKGMNLGKKVIPREEYRKRPVDNYLDLIIPKVYFEDRDADFVVDFIKRVSRGLSPDNNEGLSIISKIKTQKKVNLILENASAKETIQKICSQLDVTYQIKDNVVLLISK